MKKPRTVSDLCGVMVSVFFWVVALVVAIALINWWGQAYADDNPPPDLAVGKLGPGGRGDEAAVLARNVADALEGGLERVDFEINLRVPDDFAVLGVGDRFRRPPAAATDGDKVPFSSTSSAIGAAAAAPTADDVIRPPLL